MFQTFATRLSAFRQHHPALRPEAFYTAEQVRWFKPDGGVADPGYFDNPDNHALAWRIEGSAFHDPSHALYIAYNGWSGDVTFRLPTPGSGKSWFRMMDTSTWNEGPDTVALPGAEAFIGGESTEYILRARGVLLLIAQ
jgi:glycogen operon protein